MTNEEAANILWIHLMECSALMPTEWLITHGEDSEFAEAFCIALNKLLEEKE